MKNYDDPIKKPRICELEIVREIIHKAKEEGVDKLNDTLDERRPTEAFNPKLNGTFYRNQYNADLSALIDLTIVEEKNVIVDLNNPPENILDKIRNNLTEIIKKIPIVNYEELKLLKSLKESMAQDKVNALVKARLITNNNNSASVITKQIKRLEGKKSIFGNKVKKDKITALKTLQENIEKNPTQAADKIRQSLKAGALRVHRNFFSKGKTKTEKALEGLLGSKNNDSRVI